VTMTMRMTRWALMLGSLALAFETAAAEKPRAANVDDTRLQNAAREPQNWLIYGGSWSEQHFSPLKSIDATNVSRLKPAWSFDFDTYRGQEATPVVVDGVMYVSSAWSKVFALDAKTGKEIWRDDPRVPGPAALPLCCDVVNRGVAVYKGRVYVGTIDARLIALDAETGKEIWRHPVGAPVRGAPTVADGRVFVVTVENTSEAIAADDGRRLWTHTGTAENAGLLGSASPAVEGDVVVVPYMSGELFALRVENGRPLWTDNLAAARRIDAVSGMADIRGLPVIDRGRVYGISHSGRMAAIDLRTGERIWEQEIGGTDTPWIAGDFIFVLGNNGELVCLTRRDGRVRWIFQLPRYENPEKKRGALQWSGPVLAGDRLILLASNGEAMTVSPYTGEALGRVEMPDGSFIPPVVAEKTLYVLTNDADLIAMR